MDLLSISKEQLEKAGTSSVADIEKDVYKLKCKDGQITTGSIKFCPYFNEDETIGATESVVCHITLQNRSKTDSVYFDLTQDKVGYNLTHILFGIKERLKSAGDENALQIKIKRYAIAQILKDSAQPEMTNQIKVFTYNNSIKKVQKDALGKNLSELYAVNSKVLNLYLRPLSKRIGAKDVICPTYELCQISDEKRSIVTSSGIDYADASESEKNKVFEEIVSASKYLREILDAYTVNKNIDNLIRLEYMLREYGINITLPIDHSNVSEVEQETVKEEKVETVKEDVQITNNTEETGNSSDLPFSNSEFNEVEDIF